MYFLNFDYINETFLVFTRAFDTHFRELWLAPVTHEIQNY